MSVKCSSNYFKKVDDVDDEYKCVPSCGELFISSTGECVGKCKFGENYIGKNKKCKNYCDKNEDGKYYKKYETQSDSQTYTIYTCLQTYDTNTEFLIYGTNEIFVKFNPNDGCPYSYYLSKN